MLLHFWQIGVLFLALKTSAFHPSTFDSSKYIGAVVEYHPLTEGDNLVALLEANAQNYRTIIKKAAEYKVDIIVFPEYGLTRLPREGIFKDRYEASKFRAFYQDTASYVPHPNESLILCNSKANYAKSLQTISCAAREFGMYVVVNHHERADCAGSENCPSDNFFLYNTNVVFDRSGRVVSRYRKSTLYQEDGTDVVVPPERAVFRTDFGVTFGQLICADILFGEPSSFYAMNPEVTDVVFSTRWYGETPFYDATQIQAAWSYAADVNLLASCYSNISSSSGGSGIYAGRSGPIRVYRELKSSNALVIAEIPKMNRLTPADMRSVNSSVYVFEHSDLPTVKDTSPVKTNSCLFLADLRSYTTQLLEPSQETVITTLCDRGLCCDFHIEMARNAEYDNPEPKQYRYRLVAFNGVQKMDDAQPTAGFEVCALLNCVGDSLDHCETFYSTDTEETSAVRLLSATITRRANVRDRSLYMPSTLTSEYMPLMDRDFVYLASGHRNSSLLVMHLLRPRSDLITFGIFGRRYDRDGQKVTKPGDQVDGACRAPDVCDH